MSDQDVNNTEDQPKTPNDADPSPAAAPQEPAAYTPDESTAEPVTTYSQHQEPAPTYSAAEEETWTPPAPEYAPQSNPPEATAYTPEEVPAEPTPAYTHHEEPAPAYSAAEEETWTPPAQEYAPQNYAQEPVNSALPAPEAEPDAPAAITDRMENLREGLRNQTLQDQKIAAKDGRRKQVFGLALIGLAILIGISTLLFGESNEITPPAEQLAAEGAATPQPATIATRTAESLCDEPISIADASGGNCTLNSVSIPCDAYARYEAAKYLDFCPAQSYNGAQGAAMQALQAASQNQAVQGSTTQQAGATTKTAWDLCGQIITEFSQQGEECKLNDVVVPCTHYAYYQANPQTPFYCGEKK